MVIVRDLRYHRRVVIRSKILGIGSYVPDRVVTNEEISFLNQQHVRCEEVQMETNDEWIRARTGIQERRYVPNDEKWVTSDLALRASEAAIEDAGLKAEDIDCIILGTLSPDIHFPGTAVYLQDKLGISGEKGCACYDIRQQCSSFVYGLEMADALIKAGKYKNILLVGAEIHSHSIEFATRGRDVAVLFGDGAASVILGPVESDDKHEGVIYTKAYANGAGANALYMKVFDIGDSPMITYDPKNPESNADLFPAMKGKQVFVHAVRNMVASLKEALAETGLTWDDIDWFVPHQANLRINEQVAQYSGAPAEKVLNTIMFYGNTTAATVPLTIDYYRKQGKVKKGDLVISSVFGSGFTWGATIFRV